MHISLRFLLANRNHRKSEMGWNELLFKSLRLYISRLYGFRARVTRNKKKKKLKTRNQNNNLLISNLGTPNFFGFSGKFSTIWTHSRKFGNTPGSTPDKE